MKNKLKIPIILILIILIIGLLIGTVYAYLASYVMTDGEIRILFGYTTANINQEIDTNGLHINVQNTGAFDCYVRVKIFSTSSQNPSYEPTSDWTQKDDGYWYYNKVLKVGERTSEILVKNVIQNSANTNEFNVMAVHEVTEVVYDENGQPSANWSKIITNSQ